MSLYNPDYKLLQAKKLIKSLEGEEAELINYYIQKKDEHINNLLEQIEEFRNACKVLGKYIPYKGPTKLG